MKLAIIGCGNMAKAIIGGAIKTKSLYREQVFLFDIHTAKMETLAKKYKIHACGSAADAARQSEAILIAVKPGDLEKSIQDMKNEIAGKLVISICAGKDIEYIKNLVGDKCPIARVNPNTPALVSEGMTGIAFSDNINETEKNFVKKIFGSLGLIEEFPEKLMNAVTGLAGSGPAFIFLAIEALADGGVLCGIPRDQALKLAAQTCLGAAKLVIYSEEHPGVLKDNVASPGGTTIEGISVLERNNFRGSLIEAVRQAALKAGNLK